MIADNGAGERRRASFEDIEERARTLSGRLDVEAGDDGGTAVRVVLPPTRRTLRRRLRCRRQDARLACASV